jgi:NAD(P)-dependent dehydrogenase (short-subunit alcohol dehydrogenase family)
MKLNSDIRLDNKLVVLTGGAGILGSQYAESLASSGAKVILLDNNIAKALSVSESINEKYNNSVFPFEIDITNLDSWKTLCKKIENDIGEVDVLINNAAAKSENFFEPFATFPEDDWDFVMNVNVKGVMLGCQVFGDKMAQRKCGTIINILSIYGIVAPDQRIYENSMYEGRPINTPAVYSASKAAVWGLTKYLASYWGHLGVRVNAVTPGGVRSGQNQEFIDRYSARVPLARMAEANELCGAIKFLASNESSYITGQNIIVDGGLTVW